jgi:hypothetical protein
VEADVRADIAAVDDLERVAVPVDRPVGADERNGVQIADQAVLNW